MILPILSYGHSQLRKACVNVDLQEPGLEQLILDMWDTMIGASGCGLAAPQINRNLRLFIVDSQTTFESMEPKDRAYHFDEVDIGIKETFINAQIIERSENTWSDEEGCLSIPGLTKAIIRPWLVRLAYIDGGYIPKERTFTGLTARMIQHEYEHIEGILYLDHLAPLARRMMETKLQKIIKGKIEVKYPMRFP